MKTVNHLGTDPIGKLVPRIAFPSMLAQFVSVLYSIVDRMYIGHIASVGDLALAGVGVCGPILTMIGAFSSLIGVGGAPLLGIRLGEKNEKEASRILANAFLMLVSLSLVLTAAALFLTRPMLMAFGASTVTYPYARAYFMIYVSGSVFALLSTGLNQFVICQGFASEGMKSVLLGAILNLLLDPVFIFVLHLGVRGAAIATVLSQIASCLYVLHILFGKTIPIRITFGGYSFAIMKRILTVGFTPFLIIAIDNVMIIAMNAVLQHYAPAGQGDSFITCATIVQSFMLIITMPLGGISGGTQSILAYNYGAGNSRRILKAQKTIIALCAGFTTLMFLVSNAAGTLFAQLFTSDPQIVSMVVRAIHISTLSVIPLGIQYEIVDGFTAMGRVRYSFALSFFRKFVYFTALFLLPRFFALENIFYVEPISDLIGPVVSMIVYWTSIQKILKQREEAVRLMHTKKHKKSHIKKAVLFRGVFKTLTRKEQLFLLLLKCLRHRNGFLYFQTVFCCQLQCLLFRLRIPDGFRRMGITAENGGVSFFAGDLPELLVRIPSFFHQTKEIDLQRNVSLFHLTAESPVFPVEHCFVAVE